MWSLTDIAYYIGIIIVFITHIWIIIQGGIPSSQTVPHAYINLAAAFMIAYYFVTTRGYIS